MEEIERIEELIIKLDFYEAREIWKNLSLEMQRKYYTTILSTAIFRSNHKIDAIKYFFDCTSKDIQREKMPEVIKLISTKWNDNDEIEPDIVAIYDFFVMLRNDIYFDYSDGDQYYREIAEILKSVSVYENERGEIKSSPKAIEMFFLTFKTPFMMHHDKLIDVLKELKTYIDEAGKVQYNSEAVLTTVDMFLKDPMGYFEIEKKYSQDRDDKYIKKTLNVKEDLIVFNVEQLRTLREILRESSSYVDENGQVQTNSDILQRIRERVKGTVKLSKKDIEENLELLKEMAIPINIMINDASDLSIEEIERYVNCGVVISFVELYDKYDRTISTPKNGKSSKYPKTYVYDFEIYKQCRQKIDEYLSGIDFSVLENNPNREKIIFGMIIRKLAENISYDHEDSDSKIITSANMVGGLLYNSCVCEGYSEIVRNIFACVGIEAIKVGGGSEKGWHTWNKIKLDGEWYNLDLTNARKAIVDTILINDKNRGYEIPYFLESDDDFKPIKMFQYNTNSDYGIKDLKCAKTVPVNERLIYITYSLEEMSRYFAVRYSQEVNR